MARCRFGSSVSIAWAMVLAVAAGGCADKPQPSSETAPAQHRNQRDETAVVSTPHEVALPEHKTAVDTADSLPAEFASESPDDPASGGHHLDGKSTLPHDGSVAEAGEMFQKRCQTCHQPPDLKFATDLAWLDQINRTA